MSRRLRKTFGQAYDSVLPIRLGPRGPRLTVIQHNTVRMISSEGPTAKEAQSLFGKLEQTFPSKILGEERWYLVAVKILSHLI